ncbi:MAG: hypothetical protein ACQEVT_13765 [Pseudomonadota bacterium]
MSIWISDGAAARRVLRRAALLCMCVQLAGCIGIGSGADAPDTGGPVHQLPLYDGEVVVAAPRGYCVDTANLRHRASGAVVPMASCESLSGKAGIAVLPALISVSVLPRRGSAPPSRPLAAEIAASMAPAEPLAQVDEPDASFVHFASGGDRILPGGDPRHWRASMVINGHLLGLAVYAPAGSPLSGQDGRDLISALADTLRAASPVLPGETVSRGAHAQAYGLFLFPG